jgi:hypothetical protein
MPLEPLLETLFMAMIKSQRYKLDNEILRL